jgi:hypothetical protein
MSGERKAELRRLMESFDLNATGLAFALLTIIVLMGGVLVAVLVIL